MHLDDVPIVRTPTAPNKDIKWISSGVQTAQGVPIYEQTISTLDPGVIQLDR